MKKNILKVTLVAAFALLISYNVYTSLKSETMSELTLANVEALAQHEGGGGGGGWGEYPNIFYQECSTCYTSYSNLGAFFFCNVGFENCYQSSCIAGYCF